MTTIMALDGATITCGLAWLQKEDDELITLWDVNKIQIPSALSLPERLHIFRQQYSEHIELTSPDVIAIEDLKFNKGAPNFSSLAKVAMIIGIAIEVAFSFGYDPILLTASTVRARIGNTVKKDKKGETRRLVNSRFKSDLNRLGYKTGLKRTDSDVSDAVALGWVSFAEPDLLDRIKQHDN